MTENDNCIAAICHKLANATTTANVKFDLLCGKKILIRYYDHTAPNAVHSEICIFDRNVMCLINILHVMMHADVMFNEV